MSNPIRCDVLMCTHNGEKFLHEQLLSIARQSHPVSMIHVFDQASVDRTVEVIERFRNWLEQSGHSTRLRLYRPVRGACVNEAFLTALAMIAPASDDDHLLFFSDQDDVWLHDKTKTVVEAYWALEDRFSPVLLHHDVKLVDSSLQASDRQFYDQTQRTLLARQLNHTRYFATVIGHTMALNRAAHQVARATGWAEQVFMYDWFLGALGESIGRRVFVRAALSLYRQHPGNLIGAFRKHRRSFARLGHAVAVAKGVARQNLWLRSTLTALVAAGTVRHQTAVSDHRRGCLIFGAIRKPSLFVHMCLVWAFEHACSKPRRT